MARQVGEPGRGGREVPAAQEGFLAVLPQLLEDSANLPRRWLSRLRNQTLIAAQGWKIALLQIGSDQVVLAGEVIVERPFSYPGGLRDGVYTDGTDALAVEKLVGRRDQAPP